MRPIDFWFSIGSTYSYLTVMRLPAYAEAHGLRVNWRPFNVRTIMMEQKNIPFADKPIKAAYMWRDIERRAGKYGVRLSMPVPYPIPELAFANQVALLGMKEGWGQVYVCEAYRLWFQNGHPAGSEPNLSEALNRVGLDPEEVIMRARSAEIEAALAADTETARNIGVFGAPTFVVGDEVFWGDDRLEDAVQWAQFGYLKDEA